MKKAKESFYYLIVNIVVLWSILNLGHATSTIQVQEEPEPIGNFSLPKSQRPEAFYSFDSKILEKNQWQVATKPNLFNLKNAVAPIHHRSKLNDALSIN